MLSLRFVWAVRHDSFFGGKSARWLLPYTGGFGMVLRDVWGFRFPNTLLCLCAGMWTRSMRSPLPAVIQIFLKRRLLLDGERAMSFRKRSLFCNYKTSSIWWRTYFFTYTYFWRGYHLKNYASLNYVLFDCSHSWYIKIHISMKD